MRDELAAHPGAYAHEGFAWAETGDERAIAAYDAVIQDAGITSSGFFRYQRDELARRLSRDNALKRLPEPLAEVAQWAIERGLEV
jgi:hypothetical protein